MSCLCLQIQVQNQQLRIIPSIVIWRQQYIENTMKMDDTQTSSVATRSNDSDDVELAKEKPKLYKLSLNDQIIEG